MKNFRKTAITFLLFDFPSIEQELFQIGKFSSADFRPWNWEELLKKKRIQFSNFNQEIKEWSN